MRFYLGTHMIGQAWWDAGVPLFVSRRRFYQKDRRRATLPQARAPWALDSGGFSELDLYGEWRTTPAEYITDVEWLYEIGRLEWVAPQDWMCEPHMLAKTGLDVEEHQARTVQNFVLLRDRLGPLVVPVLQGWELDDYRRCWEEYELAGVSLEDEPIVGLGSVCRMPRTFLAALLRAGVRTTAMTPVEIEAAVAAARAEWDEHHAENIELWRTSRDGLRERIRMFEQLTGLSIGSWGDDGPAGAERAARVGRAVKLVLDGEADLERFERRLLALADSAERLAADIRSRAPDADAF